ncbi:hypothetical protein DFW101_1392 [Solidesulfovibrio carbinoliphilus subsp. oakridgensis]|uniref:Uncharacterized protein n=1 Tax=Solidesulfovibrio carbinoliphilus subsp. oakridgensis TaxID=694327 RepID=G7Q7U2_9BACT|nr:hypothetical protein [Solidesulfovibrio carbinoliphilus]EHJ47401.1 hypothetical protein DFW101_1392 [Solidesulfovibrio carbinoliphilus subsp. oakridgensis]
MYIFKVTTDIGVCTITHHGEDWNAFANAVLTGGEIAVSTCTRLLDRVKGGFGHALRLKSCTPADILSALTTIAELRPREGFIGFELVQAQPTALQTPAGPPEP